MIDAPQCSGVRVRTTARWGRGTRSATEVISCCLHRMCTLRGLSPGTPHGHQARMGAWIVMGRAISKMLKVQRDGRGVLDTTSKRADKRGDEMVRETFVVVRGSSCVNPQTILCGQFIKITYDGVLQVGGGRWRWGVESELVDLHRVQTCKLHAAGSKWGAP
jgi:hypothetical protein